MMDSNDSTNASTDANLRSSSASTDETPSPSDYEPPRVTPLGTLPESTGMPVSNFSLGDDPTR